jgi:hypothetical protein
MNTVCHLQLSVHHMKYTVVCLELFLNYQTHCTDEAQLGQSLQWPDSICNDKCIVVISWWVLMLCKLSQVIHPFKFRMKTPLTGSTSSPINPDQSITFRSGNTCSPSLTDTSAIYEGTSKSPWTASIIKYVFAFVTHRCHLLLRLCNGASISATTGGTTGTGLLELQVGCSATVHVFLTRIVRPFYILCAKISWS